MRFFKTLKLAFNILYNSKIRSWLSIIGIVIGVASVIAIMALGEGMQQSLEERLGSLGADMVTVSAGFSRASGAQSGFRRGGFGGNGNDAPGLDVKNITNKEVQALKLVSNIDYIQGVVSERGEVGYLEEKIQASVKGVDTRVWKNIETTELEAGRYLSQGDKNVVVIGNSIAKDKFKQAIPLNRQITIEGKPFRVVGILEESGGMGSSSDSMIYMPIETARIVLEDVGDKEFDSIEIKIKNVDLIDETIEQIEARLMLVRAVSERTKDFSVSSIKAMQETISETLSTMSLFLSAIAAVSLLVGAVGIANTMFTTVLEKTKDIGIMKAIGAKDRTILAIFLLNSGMIGLTGGIVGGVFGILGSGLLSSLFDGGIGGGGMSMGRMAFGGGIVTPQIVILVLGLSVLIGILSGIIPAYRASKMNPVDALRYE
ncbi:MAG: ABC transporter permease [Candidatus Woesearchaeota archaeon]